MAEYIFLNRIFMKHVYAAGIVVCCNTDFGIQYLLIRHRTGEHWDFPKGRLEADETDRQAALRELKEETGIDHIHLVDDFFTTITYTPVYDGQLVHKTVQYFIGWVDDQHVTLSDEHTEYEWLSYEDAYARLTHDRSREVLNKACIYNAD